MLKLNHLISAGIITNYNCSSKCKHCSYASSPEWPRDYMTASTADEIFSILRRLGCTHVHIGGGEPLLRPERIYPVLESARRNRISIDYIETNASWFKDEASAIEVLKEIMDRGVHQLLISIDPYHNEYIPFYKIKGLMMACSKANMGVFPWLMEFWDDLDSFDHSRPHSLEEYGRLFGQSYLRRLPGRYGIGYKGRALKTYRDTFKRESFDSIMKKSRGCSLLSGIYHSHIDLYGNFVPQSCPGLSIKLRDLFEGADPESYPIFHRLNTKGIRGLVELAMEEYGFKPKSEYAGQCDLCYDVRNYLVLEKGLDLPDLQPAGHYRYV